MLSHYILANYVRLGGFLVTHLQEFSQDEVYTIVQDIYNSTIFSDIVKRNQVRKIDRLERVVKHTFNNIGNTFSAKSISDYLKTGKQEYERLLEIHDNCPKYVITTDVFSGENYEGIKTMHISDFLLNSEY